MFYNPNDISFDFLFIDQIIPNEIPILSSLFTPIKRIAVPLSPSHRVNSFGNLEGAIIGWFDCLDHRVVNYRLFICFLEAPPLRDIETKLFFNLFLVGWFE